MALDPLLRAVVENCRYVKTAARFFAARGISPNSLSLLSLAFAALAGLSFFLSGPGTSFNLFLVLALIFVCLNALLDGLDGLVARERGNATKKGDFLEHVIDRYSDMFIISGILFGGYVGWEIGVIAIIGVLLASYMGTQAQAVGLNRIYGGLLGRADRIALILGAGVLTLVYPYPVPAAGILSFSFLGWALVIFAVLGNVTAVQRFVYAWRRI
ncbi:MAG: CDP-alcohol phosphatidyltransferase family protein [Methanophagales archaeon ANME-1-THS]|nr:MAG: CDP-alcohol phosphatidyltransferase family protein [Methanophagales archaeon ANME-1-THS]